MGYNETLANPNSPVSLTKRLVNTLLYLSMYLDYSMHYC